MEKVKEPTKKHKEFFNLSISDLRSLYIGTLDELRICADFVPSERDSDTDRDAREAILLDFEAKILEQASKVALKTDQDIQALIDIWTQASGSADPLRVSPSDGLVLNIIDTLHRP